MKIKVKSLQSTTLKVKLGDTFRLKDNDAIYMKVDGDKYVSLELGYMYPCSSCELCEVVAGTFVEE